MNIVKGFTNNISAGGLMLEAEMPVSTQNVFILEIYQPQRHVGEEMISVSVKAKVRWMKRIDFADKYEGTNKHKIGVEFIDILDKDKKIVARYVEDRLNS